MEIINDVLKQEKKIQGSIKKYGHMAQHNFCFFVNYGRAGEENIFFRFEEDRGVMAYRKNKIWRILTDPIAPEPEKMKIISQAIDWIFKNEKAEKIIFEDVSEYFKNEIYSVKENKTWRALTLNYYLVWPIIDLENWDGQGKKWKRLRNLYNKFFKDNPVEIKKPADVNKEDLKELIQAWKKQRLQTDRVHLEPYLRFVESGFSGCELARIFICQNKPISIAAGWPVPNSDKVYYSCIGLYNYDYANIGEASYWDELLELKKLGYKKVDFGGSDDNLLKFKKKFHPVSYYNTYTFSVVKK